MQGILNAQTEQLLICIAESDDPSELLKDKFVNSSSNGKQSLRNSIKELRQRGFINVQWGDNIPYFVVLNNSGKEYVKNCRTKSTNEGFSLR